MACEPDRIVSAPPKAQLACRAGGGQIADGQRFTAGERYPLERIPQLEADPRPIRREERGGRPLCIGDRHPRELIQGVVELGGVPASSHEDQVLAVRRDGPDKPRLARDPDVGGEQRREGVSREACEIRHRSDAPADEGRDHRQGNSCDPWQRSSCRSTAGWLHVGNTTLQLLLHQEKPLRDVAKTLRRRFLEAAPQQPSAGTRHAGRERIKVHDACQHGDHRVRHRLTGEGPSLRQHLVEHTAERPHVTAFVDRLPFRLFGCWRSRESAQVWTRVVASVRSLGASGSWSTGR